MEAESEVMSIEMESTTQDSTIEEYVIEDSSDEESLDSTPEDLRVGIMNEAFAVLKNTSDTNKKNFKPTLCSLLIGEIKLSQKYEKYNGKLFGYTEGIGKNPLHEPRKMASKAVIFMVISLTENWKIPVGLFFVHNPDIKYFADTIEETLKRLNEHNIDIISITMNCISPHLSFALAEELGAEIYTSKPFSSFKTYFPHPSTGNMVFILYDLDIILSCLKSYWATERGLFYKKKYLNYSLCSNVKKIEENNLKDYTAENMYDWIIIRKRISYDTESIGKTTADAMQYLKDLGHPDFKECGNTIQFVRVMDLISQISKVNGHSEEIYDSLSQANATEWCPIVVNILAYVKNLRSINKDTPAHLSVFKTYIAGIIVYFTSLLAIYEKYVKFNSSSIIYILPYLLPSKFGLKHIRLGLIDNLSENMDITALGMFKKIKSLTKTVQLIDP